MQNTKTLEKICIRTFGRLIGESAFVVLNFPLGFCIFYFAFLNIHRWLKIGNITPHGPDDGSVEPKRYRVNLN